MTTKLADFLMLKSHRRATMGVLAVAVIVIVAGIVGYHESHHASAAAPARRAAATRVSVARVASLSPDGAPLSVIGSVTSEDQATILAQTAGEITELDTGIGDYVAAGDTIAAIDNDSQKAAVTEAQGAYDAAVAALEKVGGAATGDETADTDSQAALSSTLESADVALDDAVHTKADVLFTSPRSANPTLVEPFNIIQFLNVDGTPLVSTVRDERLGLESLLSRDASLSSATSSAALEANLSTMLADAQTIQTFLGDLAEAVNQLEIQNGINGGVIVPSGTVSGWQTTVAAARTEVDTAISDLTGALNDYDDAGSQAQVEEAEGSLQAAQASLAKTYVVSPVSGTVVDLPITEGTYVSANQEVAEVSNSGALKIVAHVSADDARTLAVGTAASVLGAPIGTISQISPAIDPETGTIEVDIAVSAGSGLTDGDSVTVDLARTASSLASGSDGASASTIIPIVALKIAPTGPEVFTVDPHTGVLVAQAVQTGSILGDDIVVTSGLSPDLEIVTDARGLTEGQAVTVSPPAGTASTTAAGGPSTASSTGAR